MALIRRFLPPRQTAACKGCGLVISERRRRPCRACGSINRVVAVSASDRITTTDAAG